MLIKNMFMKKLIGLFLVVLSLSSCNNEPNVSERLCYVCSQSERVNAAAFVTANMGAANNMSDEEMEDVIEELTSAAVKLNCHQEMLRFEDLNLSIGDKFDSTKTYYPHGI